MDTQTNPHGGNMSVVVRPENVYFGLIPANLENVFRGRVTSITYMGAVTRCQVAIGDNLQLTATVPTVLGHRHISVGEEVSLGWPAASTMLVANR
jgi:ABC-type Fe3+/spermidine/putrescine transport system ATPase subunit